MPWVNGRKPLGIVKLGVTSPSAAKPGVAISTRRPAVLESGRFEENTSVLVVVPSLLVSVWFIQRFSPFVLKDSCITMNCTLPSALE